MKKFLTLSFLVVFSIGLFAQPCKFDLRFIPTKIYDYFENSQPNCIITDGTNVDALVEMLGSETLVLSDKKYNEYNLSNYNIICIGNKETNEFITTLNLPYSYNGKTFAIGDTIINAKDYNFMAVLSNPYCISNSLLHIGSITEGYNDMFFKNAQFVIFKSDSVVFKGKYYSYLTNLPMSPDEKIHETEFYPNTQLNKFPKLDVSDAYVDTNIFKVIRIDDDFKKIVSDISNKKVVLLGENHYFKAINDIVKGIVFELNRESSFPYLVIESPYSHTFILNTFLSIADDAKAADYFRERLDMIVTSVEDSIFYNEIRKWNQVNTEKKICILCTDIEHNYEITISEILKPKLDNAGIDYHRDSLTSVNYLLKLNNDIKCIKLKDKDIYPIIDNLVQTLLAYSSLNKGFHQFNKIRQKAILTKFEDTLFFGSIVKDSKFILYGGSEHTGTRNNNYLSHESEGFYLEYVNPFTRGLTYSIRLVALSYSVNYSLQSNENFKYKPSGYIRMLNQYNQAIENKYINSTDTAFIFNGYDSFTKGLIEVSTTLKSPFFFSPLDIYKFEKPYYISFQDMKQSVFYRNHNLKFDRVIVVPSSRLVTSR